MEGIGSDGLKCAVHSAIGPNSKGNPVVPVAVLKASVSRTKTEISVAMLAVDAKPKLQEKLLGLT